MGCASIKSQPLNKRYDNTMIIGNSILSETSTKTDDEEEIKKRGQFTKISAIRVSHSKSNIESIQLAYELDCGTIITGFNHHKPDFSKEKESPEEPKKSLSQELKSINRKIKSASNLTKSSISSSKEQLKNEVFEILEDDYLQEISGRIGKQVEQLTFKTYRGQQITFGNGKKGKIFQVKLSNETFGPFTTNHELNSFKIPILPIPQSFIQGNNQILNTNTYQRHRTN
ncbi:jacalin-like lectin domain protein (macronuclear) [Tetrahymena thermophila SB210]|uniref:Jacalin-like lectin domain protein n=1 Tax=Tetrahymena thermophila (strain SB210) TaxID=312017 RepID=Q24BY6_TETTS|nr:jacalin-like lectin domain protein [Tetrahymena thermophila SB210]EAS05316.1 jacalin-like lectin domain protein [Tetrahymena thermophila SB210]|eukprot:XP_001025561.1 jacalin-like lectin domain protein [Tetrahymena thermophila SB210]